MNIKINLSDALRLERSLKEEELELTRRLKAIKAKRRTIRNAIEANDGSQQAWIFEIPAEAISERTGNDRPVNWKGMVLETLERYKIPMSSELMCHKLWLNYPQVPLDKKVVMQNVSAALSVLQSKDQKLFRTKEAGKKGYVYGLKHFFDFHFNLKAFYLKQYKREEGESEEIISSIPDEKPALEYKNSISAGLPA